MSYTPPPPPPTGPPGPPGPSEPPPPGSGGYGMPPGSGGYGVPQTNQKALWSMVLGIVSIVFCGLLAGIPALILGNAAKREIAASGGAQGGLGMATAGVILGWISVAVTVLVLLIFFAGGAFYPTSGEIGY
jgi:hypothetical protein